MIRVHYFLVACFAMTVSITFAQNTNQDGVKSLLNPSTGSAAKSSPTPKTNPADEDQIKAEVAEIMAIREQLGGGISEQLKGLSLEMTAGQEPGLEKVDGTKPFSVDEAFAEQLAKQSRDSQERQKKTSLALLEQIRLMEKIKDATVAIRTENPNSSSWSMAETAPQPPMPSRERCETVRQAARMLEEAAAMLEEADAYDQADKVRQTAGELWRKARLR